MNLKGAHVYVTTDSQTTLRSLESYCRNTIRQLARGNKVTLLWEPRHCCYEGNEKADELAKKCIKVKTCWT